MPHSPPTVSAIPPGVSFVDALARGLLRRFADPLDLARATVLLPTRRACRSLQEAFLRASGGRALLLPRLLPLGDLDAEELLLLDEGAAGDTAAEIELPPAIAPLTRQLLLARAILRWMQVAGRGEAPAEDQAARLAEELGRLLDQVETEGLDFSGLGALVPERYADHWQQTLAFLRIVTEHWPAIEAEQGGIGPAARRRALHRRQAALWRAQPPADPIIAAGSTGSIPSTAELLATIAGLPAGEVVLPGLDRACDEATWTLVAEDPTHPQHGLVRLLARLGVTREEVADWPVDGLARTPALRARLVNTALAPAPATAAWPRLAESVTGEAVAAAFAGVERLDCPDPGSEAVCIALILRRAVEEPGRTAALVTPDRELARRVAAELRRWGIEIDDSAGQPLAKAPPGQFLRLTAEAIEGGCAPLALLACLKHPLAGGGEAPARFRAKVRRLELAALRGPRPAPGFAGLRDALGDDGARGDLRAGIAALEAMAEPFRQALERGAALPEVVAAHVGFAEALAAADRQSGRERLWAGEDGEAAAGFVAELAEASLAADGPGRGRLRYAALLDHLLVGRVVRPAYGRHPRLAILGPLEARLHHPDVLVLGALNEGVWPRDSEPGPWLSRPMRADFGLPPLERRIGLSAHDFAQGLGAPRVYLTRAERVGGAPSVPSRWLLRLDALMQALGGGDAIAPSGALWTGFAAALDRPDAVRPTAPPAPRPPRAARPTSLSVTRIETWMRDPYALYARDILKLRPLDPLDADPGAADRGMIIHEALERFVKAHPAALPEDIERLLLDFGEAVFTERRVRPGVRAYWMPRFRRVARWVAARERERRGALSAVHAEVAGQLEVGDLLLTAKADRIERRADGSLAVLDYKTGAPPSATDVALGLAPQLPLEAAIAEAGGFEGVPAGTVAELAFWRLSGGEPAGEEKPLKKVSPRDLAEQALTGLAELVARFADPETAYHCLPRPERAPRFNDYAHLARLREWSAGAEAEEGS